MNTHFRLLVLSFIVSLLAGILCAVFYGSAILTLMSSIEPASNGTLASPPDPERILHLFFNPALIISGALSGIAAVTNMILGIIIVAGNKKMQEGERVLWILGFILMNVITNILFLALRKSRNLVPSSPGAEENVPY